MDYQIQKIAKNNIIVIQHITTHDVDGKAIVIPDLRKRQSWGETRVSAEINSAQAKLDEINAMTEKEYYDAQIKVCQDKLDLATAVQDILNDPSDVVAPVKVSI